MFYGNHKWPFHLIDFTWVEIPSAFINLKVTNVMHDVLKTQTLKWSAVSLQVLKKSVLLMPLFSSLKGLQFKIKPQMHHLSHANSALFVPLLPSPGFQVLIGKSEMFLHRSDCRKRGSDTSECQNERGHVEDSQQLWRVIPSDFRNKKTAGRDHTEDKWLQQQACGDGIFSKTGGRLSATQTWCWEDERLVFSYCVSLNSAVFYKGQGQRMQRFKRKLAITDTQENDCLRQLPPWNWKTLPESEWSWHGV